MKTPPLPCEKGRRRERWRGRSALRAANRLDCLCGFEALLRELLARQIDPRAVFVEGVQAGRIDRGLVVVTRLLAPLGARRFEILGHRAGDALVVLLLRDALVAAGERLVAGSLLCGIGAR